MTDAPSIEAYVAARGSALVRFALVLTGGDRHRAEDVVQSALSRVLGRWDHICAKGAPDAYVRRVIVREFLSWRRRRWSSEVPVDVLPDVDGRDSAAETDALDAAWRLISGLPPRQRAVLALRYLEDWSDEQISDALGCSTTTVRSQASRALATLRGRLGPSWTVAVGKDDHA